MPSGLLPAVPRLDDYRHVYDKDDVWLPAIQHLTEHHGLIGEPQRLTLGSNVVFGVGDTIIKLFPPLWTQDFDKERFALRQVQDLPVPRLLHEGDLDGWPYLLLSRVAGTPAKDLWWSRFDDGERRELILRIGVFTRLLHESATPSRLDFGWDRFLQERIDGLDAHHGAEEPWRSWLRERVASLQPPDLPHVLLHGDLTEDHFLFERADDDAWAISALIDFGDARIGHPFYEFPALFAGYTFGQPELTAALLTGYGLQPTEADRQALTTFCLLHEFGTLKSFEGEHEMAEPDDFHRALWG